MFLRFVAPAVLAGAFVFASTFASAAQQVKILVPGGFCTIAHEPVFARYVEQVRSAMRERQPSLIDIAVPCAVFDLAVGEGKAPSMLSEWILYTARPARNKPPDINDFIHRWSESISMAGPELPPPGRAAVDYRVSRVSFSGVHPGDGALYLPFVLTAPVPSRVQSISGVSAMVYVADTVLGVHRYSSPLRAAKSEKDLLALQRELVSDIYVINGEPRPPGEVKLSTGEITLLITAVLIGLWSGMMLFNRRLNFLDL